MYLCLTLTSGLRIAHSIDKTTAPHHYSIIANAMVVVLLQHGAYDKLNDVGAIAILPSWNIQSCEV